MKKRTWLIASALLAISGQGAADSLSGFSTYETAFGKPNGDIFIPIPQGGLPENPFIPLPTGGRPILPGVGDFANNPFGPLPQGGRPILPSVGDFFDNPFGPLPHGGGPIAPGGGDLPLPKPGYP